MKPILLRRLQRLGWIGYLAAVPSYFASPKWFPCGRPACGTFPASVSSRGLLVGHFYFLRRDPLLDVRPPEAPIRAETKCPRCQYYGQPRHRRRCQCAVEKYKNTTGQGNIAVGVNAMLGNTTGSNNTALGFEAGYSLTTGGNNVGSPLSRRHRTDRMWRWLDAPDRLFSVTFIGS
jgi:hypothetical protein